MPVHKYASDGVRRGRQGRDCRVRKGCNQRIMYSGLCKVDYVQFTTHIFANQEVQ